MMVLKGSFSFIDFFVNGVLAIHPVGFPAGTPFESVNQGPGFPPSRCELIRNKVKENKITDIFLRAGGRFSIILPHGGMSEAD